jgi:endo-1,4-beta-xylanase
MKNNQFFKKTVFGSLVAFSLLSTSCSQEYQDEANLSPTKPSSARLSNANGTDNGVFYTIYTEGGTSDMTFPSADRYPGNFQIDYSRVGDVVGGKGWKPGSARTINYNVGILTGDYNFIGVYGWTKNPLIEYYVSERGSIGGGSSVNTIQCDGHTYSFRKNKRINKPNVTGVNGDFWQYIDNWGGQNLSGNRSVNMAPHIKNWKDNGGEGFGAYYYQVFGLEAFGGKSGRINATVW